MAVGIRLAVVGATGAVGQEMLKVLEKRNFPVRELICLADPREAGTRLKFKGEEHIVAKASPAAFQSADIALLAVGSDVSQIMAPEVVANNCVAIDNSFAFRMDPDVPLVVPEVNAADIARHKGIIANPNCSTTILVMAINPLHEVAQIQRVVVSTYQAVSGAGKAGFDELDQHIEAAMHGKEPELNVFSHPIAFNVIPHIDVFEDNDYTREEMKMVWETQKIMHAPDLKIAATAVRIPVYRSHAESIFIETEKPLSPDQARRILAAAPGIVVQDDPGQNLYPMPLFSSNLDEVFVGRIRRNLSCENGLALWVAADQIRKGAATNAIQIAEFVARENLY